MPHYDPYAEEERSSYTLDYLSDLSPMEKQHYVTDPHLQHHSTLEPPKSPASQVPVRRDSVPPETETEKKTKTEQMRKEGTQNGTEKNHYIPDPHITHHNTLEIPSSPQLVSRRDSLPPDSEAEKEIENGERKVEDRRDSCHRHLNVDEKKWADSSASWHNRSWLDSDFTPVPVTSEAKTAPVSEEKHGCATCFDGSNSLGSRGMMAGVRMGPCTCVDGSLHDHSLPRSWSAEQEPVEKNAERVRDERVQEARRQLLFGDEKVSPDVALRATEQLRVAEEKMRTYGSPATVDQPAGADRELPQDEGKEKRGEIVEAVEVRGKVEESDAAETDDFQSEESWDFGTWVEEGVERMVEVENAGDGQRENGEEDFVDAREK